MTTRTIYSDYFTAAQKVAADHYRAVEEISKIYLFPDPDQQEIRLLEIDPTTERSNETVVPIRFTLGQVQGIPFKVAYAVILPQEFKILELPKGWCSWNEAQLIGDDLRTVRRI